MSQAPDPAAIGPLLLDGFFQSFLLGTVVMQAFKYWSDYRNDSRSKRTFVATVVLLSLLQTILEDYKVWRCIHDNLRWSSSPLQWCDFFINGCICSMCQAFYVKRCWLLTAKRPWILCPLLMLQALTVVANIYLAAVIGIAFDSRNSGTNDILNVSRNLLPSTITTFTVWMIGTLALDVCLTATLVFVLWRCKTGSLHSDKIIGRIIIIAWESAALPSVCTIVAAALYRAVLYTYDYVVIFLVLQIGKLYTLGMLRSLNMRAKLGQKFRSVDLGGRISLQGGNGDMYSAHTSTANNSDPCPDSPKSETTENLELTDIRHSQCYDTDLLGITDEQSLTNNTHSQVCPFVCQDDGVPRNRATLWKCVEV